MPASYPAAIREFTTKRNFLDIVWAEHMNSLQEEMRAIQQTVGVQPQIGTGNPGGRAPVHATVSTRIQHVARGEQVPVFRGSAHEPTVAPNTWGRPTLRADDDEFGMHTGTGVRLCEAGIWAITIKVDWRSTTTTLQHGAVHMCRLEVNGVDIGVRSAPLKLEPANKNALHNNLTWVDHFAEDDVISIGVRGDVGGSPGGLVYNAYLRAHFVRSHTVGEGGGSVPFEPIPDAGTPPPGNVVRPPEGRRRYTCVVGLGWSATWSGASPGTGLSAHVDVVDNTHPAFYIQTTPKFDTFEEAREYGRQLQRDFWGSDYGHAMADQPLIGTVWPST